MVSHPTDPGAHRPGPESGDRPPALDAYDLLERYCRLLGHDVRFSYCRKPGSDRFCRNLPGCWGHRLDVESFVQAHFTAEQIAASMAPPKEKVVTLVELIERARNRG